MLIDKIKATVVNKIAVLKDINGNKIIPMTLTKAVQDDNGKKLNVILDEKMGKVDVVNVDTQVESDGKALNAVQANPNIEGTLAKQIADMKDGNIDGSLQKQINVLSSKNTFLCTPETGFEIVNQDCYNLNGEAIINIKLKKLDGSDINLGNQRAFYFPYNPKETPMNVLLWDSNGVIIASYCPGVCTPYGDFWCNPSITSQSITINGRIKL